MQHWHGDTVPASQLDNVLECRYSDIEHGRVLRKEHDSTGIGQGNLS